MIKKLFEKNYFWCFLILLLSLVIIAPLLRPGFYPFHDEPQIANLYQMTRALAGGQIPPRWAPDMSFNFGYPLFNFYYPLPFYLGSFFFFFFKTSLIWSLKLVFLLSVPLSGLVFYFLLRKFFSKIGSFAGATIYLFTPYRAVDLYVRGAVGEMWSFVFMPLVFLTLLNFKEQKSRRNLAFAGLSIAGLILAHNLTPFIFFPFLLLLFLLLNRESRDKLKSLQFLIPPFILGMALSAYYWLPAWLEKKYLQPGTPYNPFDHFPFIRQLLLPSWGYGASVWGPDDKMSFQIGLVNLFLALLGILLFLFKRKKLTPEKRTLLKAVLLLFFVCLFLMNIRSGFIWRIFPLGDYLQFPWRLLMLTTFFSSFLAGFGEELLEKKEKKLLPLLLALVAIILTKNYFRPEKTLIVNDNYYLNRFFADREISGRKDKVSEEYFNYSEDYLPLTIWTKKRPKSLPGSKIEILNGELDFREIRPSSFEATVRSEIDTEVLFHGYYFPGWLARLDGQNTSIRITEPYGEIVTSVAAGEHRILIKFKETPLRQFANLISFFGSLLTIYLFLAIPANFLRKNEAVGNNPGF